ncbi:M23 family metallopeptidase [Olleya namhaensis]|uniref:M23 family metallopeptidase n=1 Tax=Olleya namhaensis TaxID=1144750 RepID=UPI00232FCD38|nr:M23 family metallopeptidase [Olleya namhaensis]
MVGLKKQNVTVDALKLKTVEVDTFKVTNGYDFPLGKPDAKQYYNAQDFQENYHLGDDWNGVGGGNTDLGDPIYAIANGYVSFAEDIKGGWGNVIRIVHYNPDQSKIESVYAHCQSISVVKGQYITKGTVIGTIGTADGTFLAHLHLEVRDALNMPIGPGYSSDTEGYLDPTNYINNNR